MTSNQIPEFSNDPLKKWIKREQLDSPPADFTSKVMNQLSLNAELKTTPVRPVISRNGWIVIGLFITTIYTLALNSGTNSSEIPHLTAISQVRNEIIQRMLAALTGEAVSWLAMTSIAVLFLFLAESAYRNHRLKSIF